MRPGRHCVICGKPGGSGLTMALRVLGYEAAKPGILYAHSSCVASKRKAENLKIKTEKS